MAVDHIRYDILAQEALRGVVRQVLTDAAKKGLPGEHHFFITFDTRAPSVRLSARMREQYPEEMTIVLQHQFWDLKVNDDYFEVGLSFGGVPESLLVPFDAIKSFFDPSIQFGLQFETLAEGAQAGAPMTKGETQKHKARPPARHETKPDVTPAAVETTVVAPTPAETPAAESSKSGKAAEVVQLDRFRKK